MIVKRRQMAGLSAEAFEYYQGHPVEFVEDMVYQLTPEEVEENKVWRRIEPESKEIMRAVEAHPRVAVRSGRGISKTFTAAGLIQWFLYCFENSRVIVTGPKFDQLKTTLWAEVQKWLLKSQLGSELEWSSEKVYHKASPGTWFANIVTSKEKENIAGFHADHMLIIVDEASGVEGALFEVMLGCCTQEHNHILALGNPTKTTGFHYHAFGKDRRLWHTLEFSSENSAIVSKAWLDDMKKKYHEDSDWYRVHVRGLPPKGNPKAIITLEDCASARDRDVPRGNFIELGVDPAWEGDDLAAIAIRCGLKLEEIRTYPKTTPTELLRFVLTAVRDWRRRTKNTELIRIKVDAGGGYGAALIEALSLNETDNVEVVPVLNNARANDKQYKNLGTEMWFKLNDSIADIGLIDDDLLIEELSAREWSAADLSVVRIETKTTFKDRLGRSPDRADSVILCFAEGPKKVFAKKSSSEPSVRDFDVDWEHRHYTNFAFDGARLMNSLHYAVMVLNKDLSLDILCGIYEFYSDKLWLYDEISTEAPIPEHIANVMRMKCRLGQYRDKRDPIIIGNDIMFRAQSDRRPLSELLFEYRMTCQPPSHYDEYGAIALGAQMFAGGRVVMHKGLHFARNQINLWAVQAGKPEADNKGFCKAFLIMLSDVRRQRRSQAKPNTPSDYKPIQAETAEQEGRHSWMAR